MALVVVDNSGGNYSLEESYAPPLPSKQPKILVPQRSINGGLDLKFESDAQVVKLYDLMAPFDYTDAITKLNEVIKPARSNALDTALLATGPLLVPLAIWGVRHSRQVRKRKKYLNRAIEAFNYQYPYLYMRWNRQPTSSLTIEPRDETIHGPPPDVPPSKVVDAVAFDA